MSRLTTPGRLASVTAAAMVAALALTIAATPTGTAAAGPDEAASTAHRERGFDPAAFGD